MPQFRQHKMNRYSVLLNSLLDGVYANPSGSLIFVAISGVDTQTCGSSLENACKSLNGALQVAAHSPKPVTISIYPGDYNETLTGFTTIAYQLDIAAAIP